MLGLLRRAERVCGTALLALLFACSSDDRPPKLTLGAGKSPPFERLPPRTAAFESADCPLATPAHRNVECGWLTVPEDRSGTGDREIRLAVAIVYSASAAPAPDPVVYLEGGPGGAALANVLGQNEVAFAELLNDRDLIVFDQRGTGFSEPSLACPELNQLEASADAADQAAAACRARLAGQGIDLAAYDSAENAADVDDLRIALGYPEWNLYGISYGTRLALGVVRDRPAGVRSIVIDGVVPLEGDLFADQPSNAARAFGLIFEGCAGQAACAAAFPALEAHFYELVGRLETTPVSISLAPGSSVQLSGALLVEVLFLVLYSSAVVPYVPAIIELAYAGDFEFFRIVLDSLEQQSPVSLGMYYSVMCSDEVAFSSREAVAVSATPLPPELRLVFGDTRIFDICEQWAVPAADAVENQPVVSQVPALVLSGHHDPVTPPQYGDVAAASLSAAQTFVLADESHGASVSVCGQQLVRRFMAEPGAAVDARCVDALLPVGFSDTFTRRLAVAGPRFVASAVLPDDAALADLFERLRRWRLL